MSGHSRAVYQTASEGEAGASRKRANRGKEHERLETHHRRSEVTLQYGHQSLLVI